MAKDKKGKKGKKGKKEKKSNSIMKINLSQFTKDFAGKRYSDYPVSTIKEFVVNVFAYAGEVLAESPIGTSLSIHDFGSFRITQQKARKGRNPHSGETIKIPAKRRLSFKPAKSLREAVRAGG